MEDQWNRGELKKIVGSTIAFIIFILLFVVGFDLFKIIFRYIMTSRIRVYESVILSSDSNFLKK